MEGIGTVFNTIFLIPIINLLVFFYKIFELVHLPGSLGFAIIFLTILIRGVLWPLTHSQLNSAQRMAALKPLLDELKEKHKDKMELQKAQMELYKQHGINPAAGCLPTLIQLPILVALYQAIIHMFPLSVQTGGNGLGWINSIFYSNFLHLSSAPDPNFFGLNLAVRPSQFTSYGIFLLTIPVLTAVLTFIQSKMMIPSKTLSHHKDEMPKEIKEKEGMEDAMASMQSQMIYLMPVMIGFFAFQFPVGLAIYWNTITILGILQQYMISGWGGMEGILNRVGIKSQPRKSETI